MQILQLISSCGENAIVKRLLFLSDLADIFKEWLISAAKRGSNQKADLLITNGA